MAPLYLIYHEAYFGNASKFLPEGLKSFFALRHGKTDANAAGLAQGRTDNPLNQKGKDQAAAARNIIRTLGIRKIVSSPLIRAHLTAELVSDLPVEIDSKLQERSFGRHEGTRPDPAMYTGNYDDCEDTVDFSTRVARALVHCTTEGTLLSCHGDVIRVIMGMLDAEVASREEFDNAQVLYFNKTVTGWKVCNLSAQRIAEVQAIQNFDAKGRPSVEARVTTRRGIIGEAAAATGTTVGGHEPLVLTDGDKSRFNGMGVRKAVDNVETTIADALRGMNIFDQAGIDQTMRKLDGTPNIKNLGGNAVSSVSFAVQNAAANALGVPLEEYVNHAPIKTIQFPTFNLINGNRKDRNDPSYEHIIVPHGATDIEEANQMGLEVYAALPKAWRKVLKCEPAKGAAGGYQAHSDDPAEVLKLMEVAVEIAGYTGKICYALDCAAVDIYDKETNTYPWKGKRVSTEEFIAKFKPLTEQFNILFLEDLLEEDDFKGHALARKLLTRTNIVGDDLTASNRARLAKACAEDAIDGFVLKLNQAGTITDARETLEFAQKNGLFAVASGRSGGTISDPTAEFSIGEKAVVLHKNGAPANAHHLIGPNSLARAVKYGNNVQLADISHLIRF
jgi:enolase